MTHFADLSNYVYNDEFAQAHTRNVGWLGEGHPFPQRPADDRLLDALWAACSVFTAQSRGYHSCEFCAEQLLTLATRHGTTVLLGNGEIRIFGDDGDIFAAPNMIYHYVEEHDYHPPKAFVDALLKGPLPPERSYFERLASSGLTWKYLDAHDPAQILPPRGR